MFITESINHKIFILRETFEFFGFYGGSSNFKNEYLLPSMVIIEEHFLIVMKNTVHYCNYLHIFEKKNQLFLLQVFQITCSILQKKLCCAYISVINCGKKNFNSESNLPTKLHTKVTVKIIAFVL